jgi:hypothetical protein
MRTAKAIYVQLQRSGLGTASESTYSCARCSTAASEKFSSEFIYLLALAHALFLGEIKLRRILSVSLVLTNGWNSKHVQ